MKQDKNTPEIKIVQGGSNTLKNKEKFFHYGLVTNTRLMGAFGLAVFWKLGDDSDNAPLFFQYFYFQTDKKEMGIGSYDEVWNDSDKVSRIVTTLMSTLGGDHEEVGFDEVIYLVNKYDSIMSKKKKQELENRKLYEFMLRDVPYENLLSPDEVRSLTKKIIEPIDDINQLCHYFVMRMLDQDMEGLELLSTEGFKPNISSGIEPIASLLPAGICRNEVMDRGDYCICETLLEHKNKYYIVRNRIFSILNLIDQIEFIEVLGITPRETAMIMSKPEFITLFEIEAASPYDEDDDFMLNRPIMKYNHSNGTHYMVFKETNNYIKQPIFVISDDLLGSYFVTNSGQVIVASSTSTANAILCTNISKTGFGEYLVLSKRYHFKESVIFDFISSDIDDFEDFVSIISPGEDE